jgi:hypothetical protein
MVFGRRPWSGRLGWSQILFPFKNRPSQSYDQYSIALIDVKTAGSPDSADFA